MPRSALFAMPKSMTLVSPSNDTSTFGGEISQCTRLSDAPSFDVRRCAYARPFASSRPTNSARSTGSRCLALVEQRERAAQVAALDVLEREEVLVADAADLEHLRDVDVLQLDRDLRLVDEPRDELRVGGEVRQHLLDDGELLEPGEAVLREEDLAHAAARQPLDQQVAPEDLRQARFRPAHRAGLPLIGTRLQRQSS